MDVKLTALDASNTPTDSLQRAAELFKRERDDAPAGFDFGFRLALIAFGYDITLITLEGDDV
ncbi:hypothetical protein [Bacillus pumilus]|jgi:hypothetical protein|uniref:hypothetical protein n=1 Tax=Bacillus pumilus TaxID=1408 RepID=UPI0008200C78|nr:hypothetical protein [Bacillus pumilus]AOC55317.1 hypothetical protein BEN31_00200 [Bacillus pumilus]MBR0588515.1 hypothetical protein [Bacillus pumilus DW2J2]MBR0618445.1 hypothetical protein [Bacillus pumilus]MBR0624740.1 hypothetical protein [Bacillus pumilus]MCY7724099.1 hypothetical protein [Bacillus pumilus]